jgi:4-diphosphocytidyl-2-C-methyl-D-erythritol kinase
VTLSRAARGKVNLALAITGRRPEGHHTLRSVFMRLALADELSVSVAGAHAAPTSDTDDRLVVDGDPDCPVEGNLVLRAASLLRVLAAGAAGSSRPYRAPPRLLFRLRKRIPMGAGLAGGSSDGAAALDLAAQAWGLRLHPAERLEAALRLGADVPFFAAGHAAALVGGIGEDLVPLPRLREPAGVLLVTPGLRLATADVFREHDRIGPQGPTADEVVERLATRLREGIDGRALAGLADGLRDANDLWPAAVSLAPSLGDLRAALEDVTGRAFLLTGSGSTVFALYPSANEARDAAGRLERALPAALADPGTRIAATSTSSEVMS